MNWCLSPFSFAWQCAFGVHLCVFLLQHPKWWVLPIPVVLLELLFIPPSPPLPSTIVQTLLLSPPTSSPPSLLSLRIQTICPMQMTTSLVSRHSHRLGHHNHGHPLLLPLCRPLLPMSHLMTTSTINIHPCCHDVAIGTGLVQ